MWHCTSIFRFKCRQFQGKTGATYVYTRQHTQPRRSIMRGSDAPVLRTWRTIVAKATARCAGLRPGGAACGPSDFVTAARVRFKGGLRSKPPSVPTHDCGTYTRIHEMWQVPSEACWAYSPDFSRASTSKASQSWFWCNLAYLYSNPIAKALKNTKFVTSVRPICQLQNRKT